MMEVQAVTGVMRRPSHLDLALATDIPSKGSDTWVTAREGGDISHVERGRNAFSRVQLHTESSGT